MYPEKNDNYLLTKIVQNNIHSWDPDKKATDICKNRISNIFNVEPKLVKHVNPLLEKAKFDIVIGNPNYGNLLSPEIKQLINTKQNNIALNFLEWGSNSICEKGEMCYILPKEIALLPPFKEWRLNLTNDLSLHTLLDLEISFQHVKTDNVILGLSR